MNRNLRRSRRRGIWTSWTFCSVPRWVLTGARLILAKENTQQQARP